MSIEQSAGALVEWRYFPINVDGNKLKGRNKLMEDTECFLEWSGIRKRREHVGGVDTWSEWRNQNQNALKPTRGVVKCWHCSACLCMFSWQRNINYLNKFSPHGESTAVLILFDCKRLNADLLFPLIIQTFCFKLKIQQLKPYLI